MSEATAMQQLRTLVESGDAPASIVAKALLEIDERVRAVERWQEHADERAMGDDA